MVFVLFAKKDINKDSTSDEFTKLLAQNDFAAIYDYLISNPGLEDTCLCQFSLWQLINFYYFLRNSYYSVAEYFALAKKVENVAVNYALAFETDFSHVLALFQLIPWSVDSASKIFIAAILLTKNLDDWKILDREFISPFQPLNQHYNFRSQFLLLQKKKQLSLI